MEAAKQKAIELVNKFNDYVDDKVTSDDILDFIQIEVDKGLCRFRAIRCAKICVNEILNSHTTAYPLLTKEEANDEKIYSYFWQEVLTEIDKL